MFITFCFGWQNNNFGQETQIAGPPSEPGLENVYNQYVANGGPLIDFDFNRKYSPNAIQWDLLVLKSVLEEAKTDLGSLDQVRIKNAFIRANANAADSLSYLEFAQEIARIFNSVGCGHSGLGHHPDYYPYRSENMVFFPLDIYIIGDRYFIKNNFSFDMRPRPFDEILSINGQTPAEISKTLKMHMSLDGLSAAEGTTLVQDYFTMMYSNFVDNPSLFNLKTRNYTTQAESKIDLKPLHLISLDANRNKRKKKIVNAKPLKFEVNKTKNSAVYRIESFRNDNMNKNNQDFNDFTDSIFAELNKQEIGNLIIDIRGNTGGWTANGTYLFSYFIDATQPYISSVETIKYKDYSFAPLITTEPGYLDSFQLEKTENGLYSWVNYPSLEVSPAPNNKFNGKCYILIDDLSRSCSAVFSALMKSHTNAVFIGRETGGGQNKTYGMVMGIRLPYTGLMVHFATAKYSLNVKDPSDHKGVIPDHQVLNTIEDFKNGEDPQMKFANELIKGQ